ncbi:MAG TPA: heme-binding protein, partial [Rubrobacteraceae bacterium]|nr:heme-binding protein [Rubrobacteraceae bacterium]
MSSLTYAQAQNVLQAALRKASEIGSPSSVAIVDEGRELVAFARQDGALLASIEISIAKAYT